MSLAWVTDIHLNFLDAPGIATFCEHIAATGAEGVIVSGDISEAHEVANHLELLAAHLAADRRAAWAHTGASGDGVAGDLGRRNRAREDARSRRARPVRAGALRHARPAVRRCYVARRQDFGR